MSHVHSTVFGALVLLGGLWAVGCRRPGHELQGGTPGSVSIRGSTVADLQVNVYASHEPAYRLAYGVSDANGRFSLIHDDGQTGMTLSPGKYRITVESVSADPISIPSRYGKSETTPLFEDWDSSDTDLMIQVK